MFKIKLDEWIESGSTDYLGRGECGDPYFLIPSTEYVSRQALRRAKLLEELAALKTRIRDNMRLEDIYREAEILAALKEEP